MQRIDENTYIDDTLVTCAEYQLFIDEMREQGKYYQPDHWTSYQFPEGQAKEPILGVTMRDARAFCLWLTQRENSAWYYRLPFTIEAEKYFVKGRFHTSVGYWGFDNFGNMTMIWIGSSPNNPRKLDLNKLILSFPHKNILIQNLAALILRPLNINSNQYDTVSITERNSKISLDLLVKFEEISGPSFEISNLNERMRLMEGYLDVFTLQQRIEERSPAFEGIRFVKERIR